MLPRLLHCLLALETNVFYITLRKRSANWTLIPMKRKQTLKTIGNSK